MFKGFETIVQNFYYSFTLNLKIF